MSRKARHVVHVSHIVFSIQGQVYNYTRNVCEGEGDGVGRIG